MSAHCYNNIRRKQVNEPPGKLKNSFHVRLLRYITGKVVYRVSQNSRIPNSKRGREGPSGGRKILRKKIALLQKIVLRYYFPQSSISLTTINTEFFSLYLKKTHFKECTFRPMYLCGGSPDFFLFP
jgi:hypothetical protein